MSLRTPRTDLHPASISRTFTTAGAQIVLADQQEPNNSVSPGGAPAAGINHLPSTLLVILAAAGGTLTWLDILGNSNTLTFAANTVPVPVVLPFTAKSIEASSTNGTQITASWHPEA